MRSGQGRKNRYTLVEILLVMGIICVLVLLMTVAYNGIYRRWATANTVATMKRAHVVLDKFRLENGFLPPVTGLTRLRANIAATNPVDKKLATGLRSLMPFAREYQDSGVTWVEVFDDFGKKEPIYYIYPYSNTPHFALFSYGKDGVRGDDDIVYLPGGITIGAKTLKPGFYSVELKSDGTFAINDDVEGIAN